MSNLSSREVLIQHQLKRLDQRLLALKSVSQRYSWVRLGILVAGGLLTWQAVRFGSRWSWGTLFVSLAVLALVAGFHRRLEDWITRLRLWQQIKESHLQRLRLEWDKIPLPPLPPEMERTALDIDLDLTGSRSLHHLIDTSVSQEGSQLLADWLVQNQPDPEAIAARQAIVRELTPLAIFRDRLHLVLRLASKGHLQSQLLLAWLKQELPAGRLAVLLPVAFVWTLLNAVLIILSAAGYLPAYWIISATLYLGFYLLNISAFQPFLDAASRMDREVEKLAPIFRLLETRPLYGRSHLLELLTPFRQPDTRPSTRLVRIRWITAGVGLRMNPIAGLLLNLALPWDFFFAYLSANARQELAAVLPAWLEALHTLEALASLANFAYLNPGCTYPKIDPASQTLFAAGGLGHPLIPPGMRVCNDFSAQSPGEVIIITGSNMAGKSTFIKTIGVNLCLAYAGAPVAAASLVAAPLRIYTCIRISDSITDGYSYFYAEVRRIKGLLDAIDQPGPPLLYLIDEIFRGTNNRERLEGSRATLRALIGRRALGFLATHDLELASLSGQYPEIRNYHFLDDVRDGRLHFDYQIRSGPCPTTNALKIMQLEGLPVE
jgi:hypothetical protein